MLLCILLTAVSSPHVLAAAAGTNADSAAYDGVGTILYQGAHPSGVAPAYTLRPPFMCLMLHENGILSAHDPLGGGEKLWEADTGGHVVSTAVEVMPTNETALSDPMATPFVVNGNRLFTRIPVKRSKVVEAHAGDPRLNGGAHPDGPEGVGGDTSADGSSSIDENPFFFMNVSTLIRRQSIVFGHNTDVYVTCSVGIMDIDSVSGGILGSFSVQHGPSANSHIPHNNETPSRDGGSKVTPISSPYPFLHVVRYNVTIHAYRPGAYKWSLTISQLRLSERNAGNVVHDPVDGSLPRFFSRVMQDMFQFDADHTAPTRDTKVPGAMVISAAEAELKMKTSLEGLSIREVNHTHVGLWSMATGSYAWKVPIRTIHCSTCYATHSGLPDGDRLDSAYLWLPEDHRIIRLTLLREIAPIPILEGNDNRSNWSLIQQSTNNGKVAPQDAYGGWSADLDEEEQEGRELDYYYYYQNLWWGSNFVRRDSQLPEFVMTSGVPWRIVITVSFHVACLACSIGFICAGVPPRGRLEKAWAQAARNRDFRNSVLCSQPQSTRLEPQEHPMVVYPMDAITMVGSNETQLLPLVELREEEIQHAISCKSTVNGDAACDEEDEESCGQDNDSSASNNAPNNSVCETAVVAGSEGRLMDQSVRRNTRSRSRDGQRLQDGSSSDNTADDEEDEDHSTLSRSRATESSEGKLFQQHFRIIEKIGFGAEGSVLCVMHRWTHTKYAIKVIRIRAQDQDRVVQEAVLHSSFDHPNVVRFFFCWVEDVPLAIADSLHLLDHEDDGLDTYSSYDDTSSQLTTNRQSVASFVENYRMMFIQMEYFPRGTLADVLRTRQSINRLENLRFIRDIAEGLSYLHNGQNVVHRDLKPTNIFITAANVLKIGDFGLAKRRDPTTSAALLTTDLSPHAAGCQQEHSVVGGSPLYCSPEQTQGSPVNKPSDIFSLGVVAVELYCAFKTLHERIVTLNEARQQALPEELLSHFPEEAKMFLDMLDPSPPRRPPIRRVIKSLSRLMEMVDDDSDGGSEGASSPVRGTQPDSAVEGGPTRKLSRKSNGVVIETLQVEEHVDSGSGAKSSHFHPLQGEENKLQMSNAPVHKTTYSPSSPSVPDAYAPQARISYAHDPTLNSIFSVEELSNSPQ